MLLRIMGNNTLRQVLARRLREWMDITPALDTQEKLGARCNIAQSTVGRILRGDVGVTLDIIEALTDAFGCKVADLLTDEKFQERDKIAELLEGLSQDDVSKVTVYAQFVRAQSAEHHGTTFNVEKEMALQEHQEMARRAAQRPVSANTTMNIDTHDNDQQKTLHAIKQRRSRRHR